MGNIVTYTDTNGTVTYTYDDLGQLLSASNGYTYTYDNAGNILSANGHTYTYGDSTWADLLTAVDGETISYDAIGNPTSYYNGTSWSFTWTRGRSLATASDGTNTVSYTYDANGLRTSKTVNGTEHLYHYASGKLLRETYGTNTLDFFYDASGYPFAVKYNGTLYYYITNLQGDVMSIVDAQGEVVAEYEYDPYGNILTATGPLADVNPLRYRGYVFDSETQFYYLQSRYYDPEIGRFLNADVYASTGQGVLGNNMFAYCGNNPVNYLDPAGTDLIYLSDYVIYCLCGALADLIVAINSIKVSIETALASMAVPIICFAAAAVAVIAIVQLIDELQDLCVMAEEVVAWAEAQVSAKTYSTSQLSNYTVYAIARKGTVKIEYVGITKSYDSRNYYHQRRPNANYPVEDYEMVPIATGLTYKDARALEQTLITAYTLDCLDNMINSIAKGKFNKFADEFNRMNSLISCYFDEE